MIKLELFKELINAMNSIDSLIEKSEKSLKSDKQVNHSQWFNYLYQAGYQLSDAKRTMRDAMLKDMNMKNESELLINTYQEVMNLKMTNHFEQKGSDYNIDNVNKEVNSLQDIIDNVYASTTESDSNINDSTLEDKKYDEMKSIILKDYRPYNAQMISTYSNLLNCRIELNRNHNEIYYHCTKAKLTMVDMQTLLEELNMSARK